MREWQSQSHVKWYCRYHVVFQPQVSKEGDIREFEKRGRENPEGTLRTGENRIGGGARDVGPRSPVSEYSPEVQRGEHDRVPERQVCDTNPPGVLGEEEELHGISFLGTWVLCQHGGSRRGSHPGVHPKPGGGGKTSRAAKPQGALAPFRTMEAPSRGLHQTTRYAGGS